MATLNTALRGDEHVSMVGSCEPVEVAPLHCCISVCDSLWQGRQARVQFSVSQPRDTSFHSLCTGKQEVVGYQPAFSAVGLEASPNWCSLSGGSRRSPRQQPSLTPDADTQSSWSLVRSALLRGGNYKPGA